ncbi:unnamed protein product [Brachionus calyciflorus]|uniref:Uncharacterized protein n=1 Tax=Brachionus calyciflorus TaxID=104777 RepID=A0A813YDL8_9BILA|nr:unnamed protein product [Brachionus calyciflorus]
MRSLRLVDLIFITLANILLLILLTLACLFVVIYLPTNSSSSTLINTTSSVKTTTQTSSTTTLTSITTTTTSTSTTEYPTTLQETTTTTTTTVTTTTTTTTQAIYGDPCSSSNECKGFNSGTIRCLYGYCLCNGPSTRWQYDLTDEICKQNTGYNCALNNECISNNCRFGLCT